MLEFYHLHSWDSTFRPQGLGGLSGCSCKLLLSPRKASFRDCVERLKGIKLGTKLLLEPVLSVYYSASPSHPCTKTILLQLPVELLCIFSSPFLITRVPPEPPASLRSLFPGHRTLCDHGASFPSPRPPLSDCWFVECSPHLLNLSLGGEIWRLSSSAD